MIRIATSSASADLAGAARVQAASTRAAGLLGVVSGVVPGGLLVVLSGVLCAVPADGRAAASGAGPAPALVREIPQRFRGVWVFDRTDCISSFPNRHVVVGAAGFEDGPQLGSRRMVRVDAVTISVVVGQPDAVALLLSRARGGKSETAVLTLTPGDRELRWTDQDGGARQLFRC
jgi:hypothetical protein